MKKKEVLFILCLLVIAILIIMGVSKSKNKGESTPNSTQESRQTYEETSQKTGQLQKQQKEEKYVEVQSDGSKVNSSTKLSETKTYKSLKITNSRLTEINGITTLLADVENTSKEAINDMTLFDIIFIDEQDNEIATLAGSIVPLQPGATTQLNAGITEDIANAYDYRIVDHQK